MLKFVIAWQRYRHGVGSDRNEVPKVTGPDQDKAFLDLPMFPDCGYLRKGTRELPDCRQTRCATKTKFECHHIRRRHQTPPSTPNLVMVICAILVVSRACSRCSTLVRLMFDLCMFPFALKRRAYAVRRDMSGVQLENRPPQEQLSLSPTSDIALHSL
jgi:hypothetical protein